MKLGYADPPYIGCAHLYKAHADHLKELAGVARGLEAQGENTDAAYVKWAAAEILRLRDSLTHISSLNGQPTAQDIARMTLSSRADHA